jgi:hypothetical protein
MGEKLLCEVCGELLEDCICEELESDSPEGGDD